jgi:hypothetical protein
MNRELTPRERIFNEVQRLKAEFHNCAHCAALKEQMVRLLQLLPPEPISAGNQLWEFQTPQWWKDQMEEEAKRIERMMNQSFHEDGKP